MDKAAVATGFTKGVAAAVLITAALAPGWVMAQVAQMTAAPVTAPVAQAPQPRLKNPLNRNPARRSGVPDSAPVMQDERNSSSRPTQPAAPASPDPRDAVLPAPDTARDLPSPPAATASQPVAP